MRSRLMAAFLGITLFTLLLFGVPRGFIVAERAREQERRDVGQIAVSIGLLADANLANNGTLEPQELAALAGPSDAVEVVGPGLAEAVVVGPALVDVADGLVVSRTSSGGSDVTVGRSATTVRRRVLESLVSLLVVAAGVLLVAGVLAAAIADRLARPFRDLARAAGHIGTQHAMADMPESRIAEAVIVREALRQAADRLAEQLRREREFASNASHQLRTPLTGLRVRLEDLTYWPDVPGDVRTELELAVADVDRLSATIDGLLQLSRAGRFGAHEEVDLAAAVGAAQQRWRHEAAQRSRALRSGRVEAGQVMAPPGAVEQVMDVLVHNALEHGQGEVTLEALANEGHARLRVRDQGPGVPAGEVEAIFQRHHRGPTSHGHGIGLPLAHEIAVSIGGRLLASTSPPTTFDLVLPLAGGDLPWGDGEAGQKDVEGRGA